MSYGINTGAHHLPHHTRTTYRPAATFGPTSVGQQPITRAWGDAPLPTGLRPMHTQRPGQTFYGVSGPPSATSNVTHIQSLRQTYVQLDAGRMDSYPRPGGGFSRPQMPNDFRHDAGYCQPIHQTTVHQPRTGGHHAFSAPHISTATRQRGPYEAPAQLYAAQPPHPRAPYAHSHSITPSTETYSSQSNWPAAAPLRVSTHVVQDNSKISSPTALSPPSPASLGSVDTSPTTASPPPNKESWSKEDSCMTEFCPYPNCWRQCARRQETERHVRQHLLRCIYCPQPGCGWTGNRRYALRQHFRKAHRGVTFPEHEGCTIYDAKGLVKQLLNKEITVEQAECEARLLFQSKAAQLGKLGTWRE